MIRKMSLAIAAVAGALSFTSAIADDAFPSSVNESGPVYPKHAPAAQVPGAAGASATAPATGELRSTGPSKAFPSSVDESSPSRTGR